MWNTSDKSSATGLLSAFDGIMSPMCFHHLWHTSVFAMEFHFSEK